MSWNVDVEFRPSRVHGTGTFAREHIPAGTRVWSFDPSMKVGELLELSRLKPYELQFALHGGYYHMPSDKFVWYSDGMQFVNHADGTAANIGILEWTALIDDNCTALRDIKAGEELFEDYNFWSIFKLNPQHWLRALYRDFCPDHHDFLLSLHQRRRAA